MDSEFAAGEPDGLPFDDVFMTEVVWDPVNEGEFLAEDAPRERAVMHVGPQSAWQPAHVLTLAAASCFIKVLFRLAGDAGIPILGYVWSSKLRVPADSRKLPALTLSPCLVVATVDHALQLEGLCRRAAEASTVCRALHGRLSLVPDIQVVAPIDDSRDD